MAGVGRLSAVDAGVLSKTAGHTEGFTTHPAAEGPQAAVDTLMVLEVGQLAETLPTRRTLKGPLIGVDPHVDVEGGGIGKVLPTDLAVEPLGAAALPQSPLAVGHNVLPQGRAGGEAPSAGGQRAAQGGLTRMGEPMEVQTLLGHTAMTTHITLHLSHGASPSLSPAAAHSLVLL